MKKIKKFSLIIITIFLIGIICMIVKPIISNANGGSSVLSNISSKGSSFLNTGKNKYGNDVDVSYILNWAQILWGVGSIVCILVFLFAAIKYMSSEAADKAEVKKSLIRIILASIIIIGAYPIAKLIVSFFDSSGTSDDVINNMKNVADGIDADEIANQSWAIIPATIIRAVQIFVVGYFVVRLTCDGIRYFTTTVAEEKAVKKGRIYRTLFWSIWALGAEAIFEILYRALNG